MVKEEDAAWGAGRGANADSSALRWVVGCVWPHLGPKSLLMVRSFCLTWTPHGLLITPEILGKGKGLPGTVLSDKGLPSPSALPGSCWMKWFEQVSLMGVG